MPTAVKSTAAWPQAEAIVSSSKTQCCQLASGGGFAGREYLITFSYEVEGHPYTGEFECSGPWEVGQKFCIQYDPDDPETNTMCARKQERWVYYILAAAAAASFIAYLWIASAHAH
jgi:hypothetical protein